MCDIFELYFVYDFCLYLLKLLFAIILRFRDLLEFDRKFRKFLNFLDSKFRVFFYPLLGFRLFKFILVQCGFKLLKLHLDLNKISMQLISSRCESVINCCVQVGVGLLVKLDKEVDEFF